VATWILCGVVLELLLPLGGYDAAACTRGAVFAAGCLVLCVPSAAIIHI